MYVVNHNAESYDLNSAFFRKMWEYGVEYKIVNAVQHVFSANVRIFIRVTKKYMDNLKKRLHKHLQAMFF